MELEEAVGAFGALAQETRLRICKLLVETGGGGMAAGDIALALGVAQNTLSFHLAHLERANLVSSRRQGRFIIYSANARFIDGLILYLAKTCREKPAAAGGA
jgi:DNA-binding transcriptional ArsR family regulator